MYYRQYFLDGSGSIVDCDVVCSASDEAAIAEAALRLGHFRSTEVWDGARCVVRIERGAAPASRVPH